jgi:hypothetical protein
LKLTAYRSKPIWLPFSEGGKAAFDKNSDGVRTNRNPKRRKQPVKNILLSGKALLLLAGLVLGGCTAQQSVTLEVLNPKGVIEPPTTLGLAPRVRGLEGKKIALIHNNKPGATNLYDALEELLKEKYPGVTITRQYQTGPVQPPKDPEMYKKAAAESQAFIFAMGD